MKIKIFILNLICYLGIFSNTIVTTTDFSTKLLVDLNLKDKIIGESGAGKIKFNGIEKISENLLTKEELYNIYPTFVIGREGTFTYEKLGSVNELKSVGINPIIFYSSGPNANIKTFYEDLKKLGRNLKMEKEIDQAILKLKEKLEKESKVEKKESIVFISSVGNTLGVVGNGGLLKEILKHTQYENIFQGNKENYFQVPLEKIYEKKIDTIIILGKDEKEGYEKYLALKKMKILRDNEEIYFLKYLDIAPNMEIVKTIKDLKSKSLKKYM